MAKLRYWFFTIATVVTFFVVLFTWVLLSLFIPPMKKVYTGPVGWFYKFLAFPLLGIKVKVIGKENIPADRSFVVLSNHQSYLDIGLIIGWVRPVVFMAKAELFKVPLFGWAIQWGRCLPVYRGMATKNKHLAPMMAANLKKGSSYCIFPEGTRSESGELLDFKGGVFKYLTEKPVPILPVTLRNSYEMMPKKKGTLFPGTVEIVVHPLIEASEYEDSSASKLRERIKTQITEGLRSIAN